MIGGPVREEIPQKKGPGTVDPVSFEILVWKRKPVIDSNQRWWTVPKLRDQPFGKARPSEVFASKRPHFFWTRTRSRSVQTQPWQTFIGCVCPGIIDSKVPLKTWLWHTSPRILPAPLPQAYDVPCIRVSDSRLKMRPQKWAFVAPEALPLFSIRIGNGSRLKVCGRSGLPRKNGKSRSFWEIFDIRSTRSPTCPPRYGPPLSPVSPSAPLLSVFGSNRTGGKTECSDRFRQTHRTADNSDTANTRFRANP